MNIEEKNELIRQADALESHIYATAFSGQSRYRARSTITALDNLLEQDTGLPYDRRTGVLARALSVNLKRFRAECLTEEWATMEGLMAIRDSRLVLSKSHGDETYIQTPFGIVVIDTPHYHNPV